ncbi:MAG TPA: hypothetical protein VGV88_12875 [Candidatus Dormibacteraeota bacterium]|nr:hypothetical protein [Candidatus Dormibacteraeota bacterium]
MGALLLKPRSWIAPYVALWVGVGLLPFLPTDLDIFFWPSARIAVHGHPFSVYAAGGQALYPNANGPVSLLPLSLLGALLNAVGWLDATALRRGIALGVFSLFIVLMTREAVAAIDRLRGAALIPSVRLLVYAVIALSPVAWQAVAGYGHIEQPIEIWLLLIAARWLREGRPLRAGIAFGAGVLTRSSAVLMTVPLGIAAGKKSLRGAIAFCFGAGATGLAILLPFLIADPADVIHSLVTYRGTLQVGAGSVWSLARGGPLETVGQHYDILVILAVVVLTNLWLARAHGLDEARLFAAMTVTAAAFAMLAKTVWPYYLFEVYVLGSVWAFGTWRQDYGPVRLVLVPIAVTVFGLIAEIGSEEYLPLPLVRIEGASMFVMLALMMAWIIWFARREANEPAGIGISAVRLKRHGPERADQSAG